MSNLWRYDPDSDDFVPGPLNPFRTKAAYDEYMAANEEWLAERAEERRILYGDPDSKAPGLRGVIDAWPMSDERLADWEELAERWATLKCGSLLARRALTELTGEVRRLRRALQLSEASRGVPVPCSLLGRVVGQVAEDTENIRRAARALGDSRRAADVGQD